MRNRRIGILAALLTLGLMGAVPVALATPASAATPGQIVITEWMYNSATSGKPEFVEITNIGGTAVNMTGYSFDDSSKAPGSFSLTALGVLAPGQSGLIVEGTEAAFRTEWAPPAAVPIASGNTNNLGNSDEINIYDAGTPAVLVDRLTYGDSAFPGTIKTLGTSGVPTSCQALGANAVGSWVLSQDGVDGAKKSLSGDSGSPGTTPASISSCGPVTIVGGGGSGSALPCQPEPPSLTDTFPPANPQVWPGGASVTVADQSCAWKTTTGPEGRDMSGLVFDPSNPAVLYAAKNKSWVFRMVKQDGLWVPDTTNDWAGGKQIFFPGGVGQPDSEGLTIGADGALYVTTERDNANNKFALNSVLRFDPNAAGTTLLPTAQWNLTSEFPELVSLPDGNKDLANLGFEGVTFVPDSYLVQKGFVDPATGSVYDPSRYGDHGAGLFFTALEHDGKLYGYALRAGGLFQRIVTVDTGMGRVMDVQFDPALERIWALCDNTCSVTSTLLKINATGSIVPDVRYARPADPVAGLPNVNIEGFAIAPESTCVSGFKETVWSDDGIDGPGHEGHALYSGTFPCGLDLDANQTIDFPTPPDTAPIGTVTLHATASSGLPVSYASTTPTICTVSGSVVTPLAAGTCTIEATQAGNADFNAAPPVTRSFMVECQTLCLLNPSATGSLRAEGSTRVNAGGHDIFVNSNASVAATLSGAARVTAAYIGGPAAPAGFTKTGSASYIPTPKLSPASVDPLAGLTACPDVACPTGPPNPPVRVGGATATTIAPGVYPSLEVGGSGRLTLQPGVYVITGPVSVAGAGRLTGSGVTLYLGPGGAVSVGGSGVVSLTAPTTGPFAGFSIVGDRSAASTFTVSGAGSWTSGGIYVKASDLQLSGSAKLSAPRLVADTLKLSGASIVTVG